MNESQNKLLITIGTQKLEATLFENQATVNLLNQLKDKEITLKMRDLDKGEKTGELPFLIDGQKEVYKTQPCDINIIDSNSFVISYDSRAYRYTRVGKIDMCTQEMIKELLRGGKGTVDIKISVKKEEQVVVEEKNESSVLDFNVKLRDLKTMLKGLETVGIAYSGGVTSTFLLKIAHECLGRKCYAITVHNEFTNESELEEAKQFCKDNEINQLLLNVKALSSEIKNNPEDRCYYCKKETFSTLKRFAETKQIPYVLEGSYLDSKNKFALKALEEVGIRSPLKEIGFTKDEIREYSKALNLPNWDKHYAGCLAGRFAYGDEITLDKLHMIEKAEDILKRIGCTEYRVRVHGNIARIEVNPKEFVNVIKYRNPVTQKFKEYGFDYVTLDIQGFRPASQDEVLKKEILSSD